MKKTVLMPIQVPNSHYCVYWADGKKLETCQFFDNSGKYLACSLEFRPVNGPGLSTTKPLDCSKLETYGKSLSDLDLAMKKIIIKINGRNK